MNITDVQIKLEEKENDHLMGFANIIIDGDFIIRDLKIIREDSRLFVAMPSRKRSDHCIKCNARTAILDKFCHECGNRLGKPNQNDRSKLYVDIAHPLNAQSRFKIERTVLSAYLREVELSKQPNYTNSLVDKQAI